MSTAPKPEPVILLPPCPEDGEVFGPNQSLSIYAGGRPVAGAGLGGYGPTAWSWWALSTQGRRVFVATREEAYAAARQAAR